MQNHKIIIHSDGACKGNPGLGSWAATLEYKEHCKEISGIVEDTTNNRMELTAVIQALKCLKPKTTSNIVLYTDSQYVQKGITDWIYGWKKRNWKKVKNIDLWQELDSLAQNYNITWEWVRGHNNHKGNEYVDELANRAIANYLKKIKSS